MWQYLDVVMPPNTNLTVLSLLQSPGTKLVELCWLGERLKKFVLVHTRSALSEARSKRGLLGLTFLSQ